MTPQAACAAVTDLRSMALLRLDQILGNKEKGIPALLPISTSGWWAGIARGDYPKPVKVGRLSLWRTSDIQALLQKLAHDESGQKLSRFHRPCLASSQKSVRVQQ